VARRSGRAEDDVPARRDRDRSNSAPSRRRRERVERERLSFADLLRRIGRVPGQIGSRRRRTVLVTDGPFAETREHLG